MLIPALGARLTRNGIEAQGRPWPRDRGKVARLDCVLGIMRKLDGDHIDDPGVARSSWRGSSTQATGDQRDVHCLDAL